ncbi:MAG: hypothetical protein JSS63_01090 [Bacteroidetes bacterium]|nr:hypothetical protein [Bacteroidota bacterium]
MKETRFFELLKNLSEKDFRRLGEFLRSPYFNKTQAIVSLYNYLGKLYPYFEKFSLENASQALFGNTKKISKLRSLMSDFVKQLEKFYQQIAIEDNPLYLSNSLLKYYTENNLTSSFQTLQKKIHQIFPKEFNRDENFYYNKMMISLSEFHFKLERNEEKLPDDIEYVSENIDLHFVSTKLNMLHFLYYYKKSNSKSEADLSFSNDIIEYIKSNAKLLKKEEPIIYMKYLVLMTIWRPDEDQFYYELKSFVFSKLENLSLSNSEFFISALMNYTLEKCNEGSKKFQQERFEIYRLTEKNFIFKKLPFVNHIDFQNAISASIGVNNVRFAEQFLFDYKNKLIPEFKKDTISLAKAQILFAKKDYDEALNIINKIDYLNSIFYLKSKILQSKIYYMQKETNSQYYLIDSVKHYLKRNESKLSKSSYQLYWKYFVYLQKMINPNNNTKSKLLDLRFDLERETNIASKEWLLENLPK